MEAGAVGWLAGSGALNSALARLVIFVSFGMNALKSLHWESLKHRSPEEKKKQRKQHKNSEEKMCNKATARRLQMLSCECQEVLSHSLKNWNSPIAHQPIESNLTIG